MRASEVVNCQSTRASRLFRFPSHAATFRSQSQPFKPRFCCWTGAHKINRSIDKNSWEPAIGSWTTHECGWDLFAPRPGVYSTPPLRLPPPLRGGLGRGFNEPHVSRPRTTRLRPPASQRTNRSRKTTLAFPPCWQAGCPEIQHALRDADPAIPPPPQPFPQGGGSQTGGTS